MTEKVPVLDARDRPVPHKFMAWRGADEKIFTSRARAIQHNLEIFAQTMLDEGEFDESTGSFKVTRPAKGKDLIETKRGGGK